MREPQTPLLAAAAGLFLAAVASSSCTAPAPAQGPASANSSAPVATASAAPVAPPAAGDGDGNGLFEAPPDTAEDDASVAAGSVLVNLVDADGKPLSGLPITLEIATDPAGGGAFTVTSRREAKSDERGAATFFKLSPGADTHYRAFTRRGPGVFSMSSFSLGATSGKRVVIHAYDSESDVTGLPLAVEAAVYVGRKADSVDVDVFYRLYNFSRSAWIPQNVVLALPKGFTELEIDDDGADAKVERIPDVGVALAGTFAPGKHELEYRFRAPAPRTGPLTLGLVLPPRVAQARVILGHVTAGSALKVDGFGAAQPLTSQSGEATLMAEHRITKGVTVSRLDITADTGSR